MRDKRKSKGPEKSGPNKKQKLDQNETYLSILNLVNGLEDEGRPIVDLFIKLPSKKLYADYYDMIERPISLHEIKDKANKGNYDNNEEFLQDFELMYKNAQQYNEVESIVAKDAVKIYEFVSDQIHEYEGEQDDNEGYLESLKSAQISLLNELINYKVKGRKLSEIFMDEPSREEYPEYYQVIKKPSSFNTVKRLIEEKEQPTVSEFFELVELIFNNAKLYNEEGSQIYIDADTLQGLFRDKFENLKKLLGDSPGVSSLKLTIKPKPVQKLKISLKGHEEEDNVKTIKRRNTLESKSKPLIKDEDYNQQIDKEDEEDNENEEEEEEEDDDDDDDDDEVEEDDDNDDQNELKEETDSSIMTPPPELDVPKNITTRPPNQISLFQMINVTTNIPVTSRYMQAKNPVPPANFLDVFQLIVPPSQKSTIRAFSFTLPVFHATINFSVDLHESLHTRHYNLSLIHQGRRVSAISSTSSNPFSDNSKPLKDRFELTLVGGLNHIELILQASPKRDVKGPPIRHSVHTPELPLEGTQTEKLTFWIILTR